MMDFTALCNGWLTMPALPTILYTKTDESPALATCSLLPIVQAFAKHGGIAVEARDISLAARILASFPEHLTEAQRRPDDLAELAAFTTQPQANIVKLPNVSASIPQLNAAVAELRGQGYSVPLYETVPSTTAAREVRRRYDAIVGSAVNPLLRQGNSDRRAPKSVKNYARTHPHSMGIWSPHSKTAVASMARGDFLHNEHSVTLEHSASARIEFVTDAGETTVLKADFELLAGDILDTTVLSKRALLEFLEQAITRAKLEGLLLSLHLKATMMKISDPIMFGHAVRIYFRPVLEKHAAAIARLHVNLNNGVSELLAKIATLPTAARAEIEADIHGCLADGPPLAMVNSMLGITNLHVPSDVLVDSSIPALIRSSGRMYNRQGELQDTLALIPDSTYAGVFQAVINFCKQRGAFDPRTMGSVANVGLMADSAEEYGSNETTFEIAARGMVRVVGGAGEVLGHHAVEAGDVWRACRTSNAAVEDWVKLAVRRARASGVPTIFWLDTQRPHDAEVITKVEACLDLENRANLDLRLMSPVEAMKFTLLRTKEGMDTISVTGNILRDYLTDLFPILELGTSAKMLSVVPLLNGGGLFETGAGGTAPRLYQSFLTDNRLTWDSIGEVLALTAALEHASHCGHQPRAGIMGTALDEAARRILEGGNVPSPERNSIDTRESHFFLALYWAEELANPTKDSMLSAIFAPLARALRSAAETITAELSATRDRRLDLGGYYHPDETRVAAALRPSRTFNAIIDAFAERPTSTNHPSPQ